MAIGFKIYCHEDKFWNLWPMPTALSSPATMSPARRAAASPGVCPASLAESCSSPPAHVHPQKVRPAPKWGLLQKAPSNTICLRSACCLMLLPAYRRKHPPDAGTSAARLSQRLEAAQHLLERLSLPSSRLLCLPLSRAASLQAVPERPLPDTPGLGRLSSKSTCRRYGGCCTALRLLRMCLSSCGA